MIGGGHLKLILKIGDGAQAAKNDVGAALLNEINQQAVKAGDLHVGEGADATANQGQTFLHGEGWMFVRVVEDTHHYAIEHTAGPLNQVEMPHGDGIEAARIYTGAQASSSFNSVSTVRPYRRWSHGTRGAKSGWLAASHSATTKPSCAKKGPMPRKTGS